MRMYRFFSCHSLRAQCRDVALADTLGGTVTFTYDPAGQRSTVTDPRGKTRRFAYTDAGLLATATDALNRVTTYNYDPVGHKTLIDDAKPDPGIALTYDHAGPLTWTVDPLGVVTLLRYGKAAA